VPYDGQYSALVPDGSIVTFGTVRTELYVYLHRALFAINHHTGTAYNGSLLQVIICPLKVKCGFGEILPP